MLVRFFTAICQLSVAQILFFEVGNVDKGHATHVEAEQKDVACKGEGRTQRKGKADERL